jgi:hypothetical protein
MDLDEASLQGKEDIMSQDSIRLLRQDECALVGGGGQPVPTPRPSDEETNQMSADITKGIKKVVLAFASLFYTPNWWF